MTFCRVASIHAPGPAILGFAADARYRSPRSAIAERRGRRCRATNGEMRGPLTIMGSLFPQRTTRKCFLPGSKAPSSAATGAGGSSTAAYTHVKSSAIRMMTSLLNVLCRLMWLVAVPVARRSCRTSAESRGRRARILYHIAANPATNSSRAAITARTSATLAPAGHAFKLSTSAADAAGRQSSQSATKGTFNSQCASVSAEHNSTADVTSAASAAVQGRRRPWSGGSLNALQTQTRTSRPSTSASTRADAL